MLNTKFNARASLTSRVPNQTNVKTNGAPGTPFMARIATHAVSQLATKGNGSLAMQGGYDGTSNHRGKAASSSAGKKKPWHKDGWNKVDNYTQLIKRLGKIDTAEKREMVTFLRNERAKLIKNLK
ncbi:hypothetical protein [Agarilytica rhodophyticola]|uniref:hypothetical protein n=1 Tax=Agarilytica rhodophyticola TaxID=1737490 RepID=UPI000B3473C0|nr:hypothetical protein [Agarilytica rhodophyticola]